MEKSTDCFNNTSLTSTQNAIISFETNTLVSWIGSDQIMYHVCKPDSKQTLMDARVNQEAARQHLEGRALYTLTDARGCLEISKEARYLYGSKDSAKDVKALAIIIDNAASKVFSNFFLRLVKPPFPTKLFTDYSKGLNWLKKLQQANL